MDNNKLLDHILRFDKKFAIFIKSLCILLLSAIVVIISISIFTRFIMFTPLNFSDSLATYLLVWLSFLGVGLAFREGEHISVDMFVNKLKGKGKKTVLIVSDVLISVFLIVIIYNGVIFAMNGSESYDHIVFGMSMTIPYLSVAIGSLYALIQLNLITLVKVLEVD